MSLTLTVRMVSGKHQTYFSRESLYSNQILLCDNQWIVFRFATLNDSNILPTYVQRIIWTLRRKRVSAQLQSCWSWRKQSCLSASVPIVHAPFCWWSKAKWLLKTGPQGSAIMRRTPCKWQEWLWCAIGPTVKVHGDRWWRISCARWIRCWASHMSCKWQCTFSLQRRVLWWKGKCEWIWTLLRSQSQEDVNGTDVLTTVHWVMLSNLDAKASATDNVHKLERLANNHCIIVDSMSQGYWLEIDTVPELNSKCAYCFQGFHLSFAEAGFANWTALISLLSLQSCRVFSLCWREGDILTRHSMSYLHAYLQWYQPIS